MKRLMTGIVTSVTLSAVFVFGCKSNMTALQSEMPTNVKSGFNGEYVLESVKVLAEDLDTAAVGKAIASATKDIFKGNANSEQSLPITISVGRDIADANGGIAKVNNLLAFCTLTIWPWVNAEEYTYTIKAHSVVGDHEIKFKVIDRSWFGLSPFAVIPVPGWADERGDTTGVLNFHIEQIAIAAREACSDIPMDYRAFLQNKPRYMAKIDYERSEAAWHTFAKTGNAKALDALTNKEVKKAHQAELMAAFNDVNGAVAKKTILGLIDRDYWLNAVDQKPLAKIYRDGCYLLAPDEQKRIGDMISDEKILVSMVMPPSASESRAEESKIRELKERMYNAKGEYEDANKAAFYNQGREALEDRRKAGVAKAEWHRLEAEVRKAETYGSDILFVTNDAARAALYGRIRDTTVFKKMLDATNARDGWAGDPIFGTPDKFLPILQSMPEEKAEEFALGGLKGYDVYKWNHQKFRPLEIAAALAGKTKNPNIRITLAFSVLENIEWVHQKCREEPMYSWGTQDKSAAERIVAMFAPLTEDEKVEIISMGNYAWRGLVGGISADAAGKVLSSGRRLPESLEEKLAEMVPGEKIDLKMYNAIKSDAARKTLAAKMPERVKMAMKEGLANAFMVVMGKAKEAARNTFELDGFYLGMDWEDMKIVFAHQFPNYEIKERRDDNGEYKLVISEQGSPFCWAGKDRKVYQFNFGKKLLKKWYKYDASTIRDWAKAYSREHGTDLKLDFINRSDDVYLPNAMLQLEPYHVSLHQEIWTYKNGMKNYRLTYFGEREFGGGSSIAKAAAHDKYSFITASEGTFRAAIEND